MTPEPERGGEDTSAGGTFGRNPLERPTRCMVECGCKGPGSCGSASSSLGGHGVARPSAVRVADQPTSSTSEGEALAALAEAVQIADSGRLMSHLARCWRRIAQAKSVALAVKSRDLGHFWTVVIDNAGLITTANLQCGEETDLVVPQPCHHY